MKPYVIHIQKRLGKDPYTILVGSIQKKEETIAGFTCTTIFVAAHNFGT